MELNIRKKRKQFFNGNISQQCCVFFVMLTGSLPFTSCSSVARTSQKIGTKGIEHTSAMELLLLPYAEQNTVTYNSVFSWVQQLATIKRDRVPGIFFKLYVLDEELRQNCWENSSTCKYEIRYFLPHVFDLPQQTSTL